ncbi:MAG: hypothetical protein CMA72_08445 [Euryarchaeota archaeon]|nr:hypothetical protein [Euryarchaeota archaeon]
MTKMLFIQSEDYWGYDASSFDDTINFYKFSWTVPLAQYMEMSEEDQKRLYPCALFYVAGVTDNHNFLTLKIIQDSTEAKVSGMEGTKRRTRRYQIGSNAQYSVGSYALQAAPASATNIMEIKEAVEAGSTSEGSFLVSGFLDDAASVAKQVNYEPAEKSAESVGFAAPATEPSGSAYEPADPTVANPSTEGPSESELITMSAEIEYAELGDESYPIVPNTTGQDSSFSGHGVPQWYGAESSGSIRAYADIDYSWDSDPDPHKHEEQLDESDISGMIEELVQYEVDSGNTSGSGYTSTEVGFEGPGKDDYSYEDVDIHYRWGAEGFGAEGEGDISHSRIDEEEDQPVILRYDNATTFYEWKIVGPVTYDEEYEIEQTIESELGDSPERGQTDFDFTLDEDGREVNVETNTDYGEGRFYGLAAEAEGGRLRDIRGKFMNRGKAKNAVFGEVMSQQMGGYYRTGIVGDNPPVGQDISRRNPVAKAKYFVQPGVQNDNTGAWSKGPNFQQARKIAKGVAWDTVQDMGLAAETFASETFCADCGTTKKYRGEQEEGCGCGSMSAEMEYAELGEELYPVVPNSEGGNTALDSGYGVPQWYGSAETLKPYFERDDAPEEDYEFSERGPQMLRAIAPQAGLYFDFRVDEWEDASWAKLPDMTEEEYDACYFDFKKGGVFDSSDNLIVSMDDFAEAIFNYDIVNIDGNYNWSKGNLASRQGITDTLEEASPTKGVLVAPALAAIAGILGGIFYARRS